MLDGGAVRAVKTIADASFHGGGFCVAIPRKAHDGRSVFERTGRTGVIVPHPAVESRLDGMEGRADGVEPSQFGVLESRLRDEARLEGVQLAARAIAHLLNNDLAVATGCVDLLQFDAKLPRELRALLESASDSLEAAARHIEQLQSVVRVVVEETPAGQSLDLERSQRRSS